MKALILAAGRGSRMKNRTNDRPKCLVPFRGKPLLEHQILAIQAAGIKEIGLITGYRREMLAGRGLYEFHNPNWESTQMVTSLVCAQDWLEAGPCLVSYSDIFYETSAVSSLMKTSAKIAVTYAVDWLSLWEKRFGNPLDDAETFRVNPDHTIAEIGRKAKLVAEIEGQYMGLIYFHPEGWQEAKKILKQMKPEEYACLQMTALLQKVVEKKSVPVAAIPFKGIWGEVDSEEDLLLYEEKRAQKIKGFQ
jgi:choline kinase